MTSPTLCSAANYTAKTPPLKFLCLSGNEPPFLNKLQIRYVSEHLSKVNVASPLPSSRKALQLRHFLILWGCCWHLLGQQQRALRLLLMQK